MADVKRCIAFMQRSWPQEVKSVNGGAQADRKRRRFNSNAQSRSRVSEMVAEVIDLHGWGARYSGADDDAPKGRTSAGRLTSPPSPWWTADVSVFPARAGMNRRTIEPPGNHPRSADKGRFHREATAHPAFPPSRYLVSGKTLGPHRRPARACRKIVDIPFVV